MSYRIYLSLSVVLAIALASVALIGVTSPVIVGCIALGLLAVIILGYFSVSKPLAAVRNGIWLLRSQDFGSRLRLTGQSDADNVIELFNRMMDTMKAERLKLMEQNLFLTKLIEVSPLGIAICDFDDNVIQSNPVYRKLQSPALEELLTSLKPDETRVVRLGTSQIYRCSRLWFMDSGFRRTCYIIEMLTEDIVSSERSVFRTVVRTIGHEVNNTLGPVISVLDTLSELNGGDPMVSRAIDGSRDSCCNLLEFVQGYSRIVKLPEPMITTVDLSAEISRLMPVLSNLAADNVSIRYSPPVEPVMLRLDMMLTDRAIINVVKNAVESIGPDPDGEISIHLDGPTLRIVDNGPGISDEISAKLFTPFFSTKRPDRGLGLMLVADILRSQHAAFSLRTDPANRLTTFAITFSEE